MLDVCFAKQAGYYKKRIVLSFTLKPAKIEYGIYFPRMILDHITLLLFWEGKDFPTCVINSQVRYTQSAFYSTPNSVLLLQVYRFSLYAYSIINIVWIPWSIINNLSVKKKCISRESNPGLILERRDKCCHYTTDALLM